MKEILLGVNIDHVATIRQARGTDYPDLLAAALLVEQHGADSITVHLREDRRHIQDDDIFLLQENITTQLNLEMAVTDEMVAIAEKLGPAYCCFVPEKREELTTEGGLDVMANQGPIKNACARLQDNGSRVSLFIDPVSEQINAAKECGALAIELHTGHYANSNDESGCLAQIQQATDYAQSLGLVVNAGHGLTVENVGDIAAIAAMNELNIGHSIVARAMFVGLGPAVAEMKALMQKARL